ncbi:MAG: 4-hydroxy-3-methylbut-2-enyl diphosphate reductase [candidate division Zixibacteria bacterium]|nr:4-hydroxy-3-methylbut-2-enyl diphosphate reductase [candidate division Zixibacteria bacterium]
MKVSVVKKAGFCFGVKRAIKLAFDVAKKKNEKVYTWGPLIHNPQVVEDLKKKGVYVVEDLRKIKKGTLIIRSHGIHPEILKRIKKRKIEVVDATCPFVKKAQRQAKLLSDQGYQVVVVGEADHPEVQGIMGYANDSALVINHNRIKRNLPHFEKLGVIAQTTLNIDAFKQVIGELIEKADELKVCNTLCYATARAQKATLKLAGKVDMMIVVGGHNSANTTRLAKLCRSIQTPTHHIETTKGLRRDWLKGKRKVGVTAGTSTPDWIIREVVEDIKKYN